MSALNYTLGSQFGSMSPAEKLALIRGRFRSQIRTLPHKPKGLHVAQTGAEPVTNNRPKDRKRTSGRYDRGSLGPVNQPRALTYAWVQEPDLKTGTSVKAGFRHEPHALTNIANKWYPKKCSA
jgi:hypothetical protein